MRKNLNTFFSGFMFKNEKKCFKEFLKDSQFTVSGFSLGAILAFEYVLANQNKRIDTLQLFSPAFFQTKEEKFKRLQLMSYKKSKLLYLKQFMKGCFFPYEEKMIENIDTDISELKELLEYEWSMDKLKEISQRGVKIEVYLGSKDAIIDVLRAKEFFLEVATVTYIKEANHFLLIN